MGSPITAADFNIQNFSADVCERLRKLLELNNTLKTFFDWMFNDDGTVSSQFKLLIQDIATPVGAILWRPITSVPSGYLVANGQAVSRTTYANLFAVYGTTFGTGDGSTTFNLPNLQAKFLLGAGAAGLYPVGSTGGEELHTLTVAEGPAHTHTIKFSDAANGASYTHWSYDSGSPDGTATEPVGIGPGSIASGFVASSSGGGQGHNNMPPYMAGLWLIKT